MTHAQATNKLRTKCIDERTFFMKYILLELYHLYFISALNIHKTPICTLSQGSLKVHDNALI